MNRIGKIVGALALLGTLTGCTDEPRAKRVLAENGYKDVKMTGYKAWSCSDKDTYATGFEATSPAGIHVSGAVCSGYTKGATIRFD